MTKYRVHMTRIGYADASFDIDAPDKAAARELAHDQEGDHLYNEHDAEYEIDDVTEVPEHDNN